LRRLAERRIEDAMKEGKFDNLPGKGQDIVLDPIPAEENARMMWWVIHILKNNNFTPDEIRWRKMVDELKARLHKASSEAAVAKLVAEINELVRKLNTLGTNAISLGIAMVDVETELRAFRERLV
jgi:hypothetical protein